MLVDMQSNLDSANIDTATIQELQVDDDDSSRHDQNMRESKFSQYKASELVSPLATQNNLQYNSNSDAIYTFKTIDS